MQAGLIGLVCCGLLVLAIPRFIASVYALHPEAVYQQIQDNLPVAVYEKSVSDLSKALVWYENPDYRQLKAVFLLLIANAQPADAFQKKRDLILQARDSMIQGLKLSPVDPYAWFRLATLYQSLNMPDVQIIDTLQMSFYAGRVEPDLLMPRLVFSYNYFNSFNAEVLALWKKQLPVCWIFHPDKLVEFVATHPNAKHLVEEALVYSPDDWKKFSYDLEIFLKKNSKQKPD